MVSFFVIAVKLPGGTLFPGEFKIYWKYTGKIIRFILLLYDRFL